MLGYDPTCFIATEDGEEIKYMRKLSVKKGSSDLSKDPKTYPNSIATLTRNEPVI